MVASARFETTDLDDVQHFLNRWSLTASAGGALWVQPRTPMVSALDFCSMLCRVHDACAADHFLFAVFHFDGVRVHRNSWPIILNAIEVVATSLDADWWILRSGGPVAPGHDLHEYRMLSSRPGEDRVPGMITLEGTSIVVHPSAARLKPANGMNQGPMGE